MCGRLCRPHIPHPPLIIEVIQNENRLFIEPNPGVIKRTIGITGILFGYKCEFTAGPFFIIIIVSAFEVAINEDFELIPNRGEDNPICGVVFVAQETGGMNISCDGIQIISIAIEFNIPGRQAGKSQEK